MIRVRQIEDNVCEDNLVIIGKKRLVVVGYTDGCYSEFGTNDNVTEALVMTKKCKRSHGGEWVRFRFLRICRLPFKVKYQYKGSDHVFDVRPELWLKLNKVYKC